MPKEIERKFLVDESHPELARILACEPTRIRQGYLKSDDRGVVRVRVKGARGFVTIKGPTRGITRDEFEYEIPLADAEAMLDGMCQAIISKSRFTALLPEGLLVEIDVFDHLALVLAEVELPDENAVFTQPEWFTAEVSHDPAYFNNAIAERIAAR